MKDISKNNDKKITCIDDNILTGKELDNFLKKIPDEEIEKVLKKYHINSSVIDIKPTQN